VRCRVLFERGELRACDFVGAFILAFVAMRNRKWTMGPLHPAIGAAVCNDTSARIGLIPGLANLLRHELERVWPSSRGAAGPPRSSRAHLDRLRALVLTVVCAVGAIEDISLDQVREAHHRPGRVYARCRICALRTARALARTAGMHRRRRAQLQLACAPARPQ
jgi:hypothetical protein